MKVLFVTEPGNVSPWYDDFVAALGGELEVLMFEPGRPFASQVREALAVVDTGAFFDSGMVPEAREAGVKLWHLLIEGSDKIDLDLFRANGIAVANTPGQTSARALAERTVEPVWSLGL